MRALDTPALLDAWDRGHSLSADAWALWLLRTATVKAGASTPAGTLAQWTVGRRDRALLRLRSLTFGASINGLADCPGCGAAAEFDMNCDALAGSPSADDEPAPAQFEAAGYAVTCRAVTAGDLLAIADCADVDVASDRLLERCVDARNAQGVRVAHRQLPADLLADITIRLELADPHADIQLNVRCPACGHGWQVAFDIVQYFWRELGAWATRQLRDVHELASAYGWSEAQILALSPARRQRYLDMLTT
ncbi:hypothetical protein M0D69_16820 [Caballeronia sp. SEWSISQ10-4 2]|uniref:T4 family baseplate hub assembly chaperone n=1 Tax=Caballeronia sp. SEWSISQ10-4 2 TaxID=2937438 RepID=UPI002653187B|nr:hypothetical protein [Caballeronia sp. SEWSISQ10-4 2]MDN7179620.1 hypothetical protein [Caballeronia sp. SEWSISQ10-4 2]